MHFFQQEEYDEKRFFKWVWENRVFDRRLSAALAAIMLIWLFTPGDFTDFLIAPLAIIAFGIFAGLEKDPRKQGKKKLVLTNRARRIFWVAMGIMAVPSLFVFATHMPLIWIIIVQLIPLSLGAARKILQKQEDLVQQKYWNEAHEKVTNLNPTVIAITGSFGKTSVKHILGHVLSLNASTLITPGSVNTPMGISQVIRERLNEDHKYFIVEMGAYGPGSIERLCQLTPPNFGIITSIGHAHYERFKTLDTVARAKYELAEAVIAKQGTMIVDEKTLKFQFSGGMAAQNPNNFMIVGDDGNNPLKIISVYQKQEGIEVKIRWQGKAYTLKAHLYGSHHGENMALAFAMACTLGMEPNDVITAMKSVPQIRHRLEVKQTTGRVKSTIIDDAYNSNPRGFRTALDLLDLLAIQKDGPKFRRICITPGMVELGGAHDDQHYKVGEYMVGKADLLLTVKPERIPTLIKGFEDGMTKDQAVITFDTYNEAQKWVNDNMRGGDTILIENDLPDLYERVPKL